MRKNLLVTWFILVLTSCLFGQVPASELTRPPADARHFIIGSPGGKHGDSWSWITADGTRMARESMNHPYRYRSGSFRSRIDYPHYSGTVIRNRFDQASNGLTFSRKSRE